MSKVTMTMMALSCLCFVSCGGDDESESIPDPASGTTKEEPIKPSLDSESMRFVGLWQGNGPYYVSVKSYALASGTWRFNNDGTYYWNGTTDHGYTVTDWGKWHYNSGEKLLITDSFTNSSMSVVWNIMDATEDSWVGNLMAKDAVLTYKRQSASPIRMGSAYVADFGKGMLRVQFTLANYLYSTDNITCGICYADSTETDREKFQKIYATTAFTDVSSYKDGTGTFDVTIRGLKENGKYRLHAFLINGEDVVYSNQLRAICITPPDSTFYMGTMNGNDAVFWFDDEKSVSRLNPNYKWELPMPEDFQNISPYKTLPFETVQPFASKRNYFEVTSARNGNSIHFLKFLQGNTHFYHTNKTQGSTWYYCRFWGNGRLDTEGFSWRNNWNIVEYGEEEWKYVTRIIAAW